MRPAAFPAVFCVLVLALLLEPRPASAALCFKFTQTGFSGSGFVTGSFCGKDLDGDGILNSFTIPTSEIIAYSMAFSGSPSVPVPPFTHTIADFATAGLVGGLIYALGSPFLGDLFVFPFEGIASGPISGSGIPGHAYRTGMGPTGVAAAFGFVEDNTTPLSTIDHTSSFVVVTQVPEPSAVALLASVLAGLAAAAFGRRRRPTRPPACAGRS